MENEDEKKVAEAVKPGAKSVSDQPAQIGADIATVVSSVSENVDQVKYRAILMKVLDKFGKNITADVKGKYPFSVPFPVEFNAVNTCFYVEDGKIVTVRTDLISDSKILEFLGGKESEEGKMFLKTVNFNPDMDLVARFKHLLKKAGVVYFGASIADDKDLELAKIPGFMEFYQNRDRFRL